MLYMLAFSLPFSSLIALLFLLALAGTTIFSFILIYHWRAYGEKSSVVTPTVLVYLAGIVCFFAGMGSAVLAAF